MTPNDYDKILAVLRKLVALIDALFLYGARAALGIAGGAAIVVLIIDVWPVGGSELKYSAEWVLMGALGAATGCWLVLLIQRLAARF